MTKFDKLIAKILKGDSIITIDEAIRVLEKIGYSSRQPKSGSSHITFFKPDYQNNITLVLTQKELKPYQIDAIQEALRKEGYHE